MGIVIIILNLIIILQLLDIRLRIPPRDLVEEALIRDEKRRKQLEWERRNNWKG